MKSDWLEKKKMSSGAKPAPPYRRRALLPLILILAPALLAAESRTDPVPGPSSPLHWYFDIEKRTMTDDSTTIVMGGYFPTDMPRGDYEFRVWHWPENNAYDTEVRIYGPGISHSTREDRDEYMINWNYRRRRISYPQAVYPYKIRFYIEGHKIVIPWTGEIIYKAPDVTPLIGPLELHAGTTPIPGGHIRIFDLNPGEYLRISDTYPFMVRYALDGAPPNPPDPVHIQGATLMPDGNYYVPGGPVTLVWNRPADNGTPVGAPGAGATTSGIWGYIIIDKINDPPGGSHGVIPDQRPVVYRTVHPKNPQPVYSIKSVDKAGHVSTPSLDITMVVDSQGPEAPAGLALADSKSVAGKGLYALGEPVRIQWSPPQDLPAGTGVGIDSSAYRLHLNHETTGSSETRIVSGNTAVLEGLANGRYTATLQARDLLGNLGELSPALTFYVDRSAPPAVDPAGISIADPRAQIHWQNALPSIYTGLQSFLLSWMPVSDGPQEWQSGLAGYNVYEIRDGNRLPPTRVTTAGLQLESQPLGSYLYELTALDGVGNESAATQVRIIVTFPPEVTFPESCYEYSPAEGYKLRWNPVVTIPPEIGIAHYKVLIGDFGGGQPGEADFAVAQPLTVTKYPLNDVPQGVWKVAYVRTQDNLGNASLTVKPFYLPPLVIDPPGDVYELQDNEYWWEGLHELHATVLVPPGVMLTMLPGCLVRTYGESISLIVQGRLRIQGQAGAVILESAVGQGPDAWKGVMVEGRAEIAGTTIRDALRGLSMVTGAQVTIEQSRFLHNRVGIHAYGEGASIRDSEFRANLWYGIKEDAIDRHGGRRPTLVDCTFGGNGYDYYHQQERDISMERLNQLSGNSGNRRD